MLGIFVLFFVHKEQSCYFKISLQHRLEWQWNVRMMNENATQTFNIILDKLGLNREKSNRTVQGWNANVDGILMEQTT